MSIYTGRINGIGPVASFEIVKAFQAAIGPSQPELVK